MNHLPVGDPFFGSMLAAVLLLMIGYALVEARREIRRRRDERRERLKARMRRPQALSKMEIAIVHYLKAKNNKGDIDELRAAFRLGPQALLFVDKHLDGLIARGVIRRDAYLLTLLKPDIV